MSRESMIDAMERLLGLGEPNYVQSWYAARNGSAYNYNFPWCNASITYAAVKGGEHDSVCMGTDYAYTVSHAERFRRAGRWHRDVAGIRRGDIVFIDWDGSNEIGRIDHVGIVTQVSGGYVYTIEGNTANVCARRVRTAATIAGYGRPDYSANGKTGPEGPARYTTLIGGLKYGYGATGAHVTAVDKALVKKGFDKHHDGDGYQPGPEWTDYTTENYADYQRSLGYRGDDADGVPGEDSLKKLLGKLPAKPKTAKTESKPPPFPGRKHFALGADNAHAKKLQTWLHKGDWGPRYKVGPSTRMNQIDLDKVAALQRHFVQDLGPADGLTGPRTWRYAWEVAHGKRKK